MNTSLRMLPIAALALLSAAAALSLEAGIPMPADKDCTVSLNGVWRFKLEQAPPPPRILGVSGRPILAQYPTNIEPFYLGSYHEDAAWHDLAVPGNWEMAGFSPATYNQPDNASGLYRLQFRVPEAWKGREVKINFDGVQNGCEVWCNGQPVPVDQASWGRTNYHESGWTAWQADLTGAVDFGRSNLLALRVIKNTKSVDCDTGDFFLLGGVHRPVTLFAVPPVHLADLAVATKLQPASTAQLTVTVRLEPPNAGASISMRLEGQKEVHGKTDAQGQVILTQLVPHPKLWSAEFPNLYSLSVQLHGTHGEVTERLTRRIGLREISIENGVFLVNHVPVKLVGICRHDVYPTLGTAITPEVWRKDLTLMKAANFNAVRTSHYPYGSGFYDLCDELGFYVIDEEPFCWVNCDDPELPSAFAQRAEETVQRDKCHPCVVIWGVGNENKPGRDNALAAKLTRQIDPTRPRLISCQRADEGTEPVEFDDAHYVTPQRIHRDERDPRRSTCPMIYTENPNVWDVRLGPDYGSLDLWGAVIERTWNELWQDDHVAGTFLWEWQDRAVADKCTTKYYYFFPKTGINLVKVKGVVDGFRNPRPEYFHIKMAQSPIAVSSQAEILGNAVQFMATNRYSFTELKSLSMDWYLGAASRTLAQGSARLSLAPRSHAALRLNLPSKALAAAETLRLDFTHPGGWNVFTCQFPLKPTAHPPPQLQDVGRLLFPKFNLVTGKRVRDDKGWWRLDRTNGDLVALKVQRKGAAATDMTPAALAATPLDQIESLQADIVLPPGATPVAHLQAQYADGKLGYQVTWKGAKTDVYELGWIFKGPRGVSKFSWDRKAFWSYYPPNHVGRPTGTATPDSARVDLTKVDQPDAFDFTSTKFDCNWVSLTDAANRGFCLVFSPQQRQHVRGNLDPDGGYSLVVDRCYSPPRDISTPIVPDLYTVLNKAQQVTGDLRIQ